MYKNEELLNSAYKQSATVESPEGQVAFTRHDLGALYLATGHIVANDPFVCYQADPFTVAVPPGAYPVSVSVADFGNDKRVACAMIKFSDSPPARWEMAVVNDEQAAGLAGLDAESFFGYGVDAGTGGFMDKSVADKAKDKNFEGFYVLRAVNRRPETGNQKNRSATRANFIRHLQPVLTGIPSDL